MLKFPMMWHRRTQEEIAAWTFGWYVYGEKRLKRLGAAFERKKNLLVEMLLARRGSYQRPFLHISVSLFVIVGSISAPVIASTYQKDIPDNIDDFIPPSAVLTSLDVTEYNIETQESKKPPGDVVTYIVKPGDTLSTIAEKFAVSVDTVRWANDIKGDSLSIGQQIKVPPITGVVHKVKEGETIYTIAKRYKTDAQKIVNFPFNDFVDLETFALAAGQTLIVPDGVMPQAPARIFPVPPIFAGGTGQFLWPVGGVITQYPVWYHNALDIANPSAPGIASAEAGTVSTVQYLRYGYGTHIIINHGNGLSTLYAHLSEAYVKPGDSVGRGQIIGRMGSTGRSTGTHLHFEVRNNGKIVDPRPFLK